MNLAQLGITDIRERLRRMMYSITVLAFRESGKDRKDLLTIRDEIKTLLKNKNLEKDEILKELGFILIGLSILASSVKNKVTRRSLLKIIDDFSSG